MAAHIVINDGYESERPPIARGGMGEVCFAPGSWAGSTHLNEYGYAA